MHVTRASTLKYSLPRVLWSLWVFWVIKKNSLPWAIGEEMPNLPSNGGGSAASGRMRGMLGGGGDGGVPAVRRRVCVRSLRAAHAQVCDVPHPAAAALRSLRALPSRGGRTVLGSRSRPDRLLLNF